MTETQYRIYPDGTVLHESEFEEADLSGNDGEEYRLVAIPDNVELYVIQAAVARAVEANL